MSRYDWFALAISFIGAILLPMVYRIWRTVQTVRANDLAHIDARLESIERKIDQHIRWHAERSPHDHD